MSDVRSLRPDASTEREVLILENRLREGEVRIAQAEQAGNDVTEWEDFWLELLHRYEALCREAEAVRHGRPIAA